MPTAEELNLACFQLARDLEGLQFAVPEAGPLARTLLRVVGRVLIDTAGVGAGRETWPNTEEMALRWIDEAIRPLGYAVSPAEGGGRAELTHPSRDW